MRVCAPSARAAARGGSRTCVGNAIANAAGGWRYAQRMYVLNMLTFEGVVDSLYLVMRGLRKNAYKPKLL